MLNKQKITILLFCILFLITGCTKTNQTIQTSESQSVISREITQSEEPATSVRTTSKQESGQQETKKQIPKKKSDRSSENLIKSLPAFSGSPYIILNDNVPDFSEKDKKNTKAFERYSNLDSLRRCGVAYANICEELMPTEERGAIGSVKPTGWHLIKYDIVDGKYLFNRCHLIGFQLAGENANERNLITGTRYLNVEGMLPFENAVADYVGITGNHVLYRVTPVFEGKNLVAKGVQMEAYSVEDKGAGVCFNVFAYNNQPGITIDYATGESRLSGEQNKSEETTTKKKSGKATSKKKSGNTTKQKKSGQDSYIINMNTRKFHRPTCSSVSMMNESNKREVTGTREQLIKEGYDPCQRCNP